MVAVPEEGGKVTEGLGVGPCTASHRLAKLLQSGADLEAEPVWSGSDPMQRAVVMSYPNLEEFNAQVAAELASTREQLTALEAERAAQARSIARKRHDWMPFSTEMLK
ncbi:MAG: uncharacterized protein KVP18_004925 [Porospora cf. gigantea A]|uniref:uncharacterized protein n=1 Tax=Porospora cf. gigantea A TaxID=2853593 RepID=UPI003559D6D5|nr:MAG: hypothetical protein KVP18_004925 [Porospora cf. gigantea A]